ncbi:phosphoesterase [Alteromonas pelagimontana]|uniref:Phosphoesterase n=1 Tax=Alteromonas pelagimontana TaxID=1858656 RepID=A0A6M4MC47_9ALTE|nr:phosphoesterase [Alteromonas pelagimontana]QJR80723.1 phosphoesterase [Alteromonas pelagimontana]
MQNFHQAFIAAMVACAIAGCSNTPDSSSESLIFKPPGTQQWLAGDHHIHGKYSVKWNWDDTPPSPIVFGDAHYFTALNARMAALHGLDWMVTTDHGGPGHSRVNLEQAYPELVASRKAIPGILQFYGMEFDTPAARHSTLIIAHGEQEADQMYQLEKQFNRREIYPDESPRDTEDFMLKALTAMQKMSPRPLLSANHPARLTTGLGKFDKVTPREMRNWQDTAPDVFSGMTAIPGHQAATINPDGSIDPTSARAEYNAYPTLGGADQMSAIVGGVWDSFLGEGRKWSVTAVSDSHAHYTEGRTDFWPGEYAKTYVYADKNYASVLAGLKQGRVFITTGDLINELYVSVTQPGSSGAAIGEELAVKPNLPVTVTIAFRTPEAPNYHGDNPAVGRVDLIMGNVNANADYAATNRNPTSKVIKRFYSQDWQKQGQYQVTSFKLDNIDQSAYFRVRGTNQTQELEPAPDPKGEDPWQDLWFYSSPLYLKYPS